MLGKVAGQTKAQNYPESIGCRCSRYMEGKIAFLPGEVS